jgi:hypothetical protein
MSKCGERSNDLWGRDFPFQPSYLLPANETGPPGTPWDIRQEMQDRYGEHVPSFLLTPAPPMIFLRSSAQKILEARAFRPDAPMLLSHFHEVAFTVAALATAGVHGRYAGCQQVGRRRDEIGFVHDDQGGGEGAAAVFDRWEGAGHGAELRFMKLNSWSLLMPMVGCVQGGRRWSTPNSREGSSFASSSQCEKSRMVAPGRKIIRRKGVPRDTS